MDTSSYLPDPTTIEQDVSCCKWNETPALSHSRQELICLVLPSLLPWKGQNKEHLRILKVPKDPCSYVVFPSKADFSARGGAVGPGLQTKLPESNVCLVLGLGHRNRA